MTTTAIETDTQSDLRVEEEVELEKLRHIINPPSNLHIWRPGMSAQDVVNIARVRGIEVMALCGVMFVPTRNPEEVKKTCDTCLEIAGIMLDNPPE